mmetsp:Transcript_11858/g.28770  ORF Transcript_11858/g.28770 Transcript_11858/m.28770 type:complete len:453 (-) Transcript_11858:20-1378(-)
MDADDLRSTAPPMPGQGQNPDKLLSVPVNVQRVFVHGNERTKRALVEAELANALAAHTHRDLAIELSMATQRLEELDIFKSAVCEVDLMPGGKDDAVQIDVRVEEKGLHTLSTGTYMQGGEGNFEVAWTLRNFFGDGEKLQSNASMGHKTSNSFKVDFSRPLSHGSAARFSSTLFQSVANLTKYSSFRERQRGVAVALTSVQDGDASHEVHYEGVWRSVTQSRGAMVCRPDEAGDSFKSSIRHNFTFDRRDDPRLPEQGMYLRSTTELAGLGGDVRFLKAQVDSQLHAQTNIGVNLSLIGSFGLLQALGGDLSRINDRFFVGGPLAMRGFRTKGLGPRVSGAGAASGAKGGDAFFTLGASAAFPLPSRLLQVFGVQAHVFCNLGNNVACPAGQRVPQCIPSLLSGYRAVVGAGLVVPLSIGRVELNYTKGVRTFRDAGDRTARWQVAVGLGE